MKQEFLVDGKLCGKDLNKTRCPQAYDYTDLDTFLKANHYLPLKVTPEKSGETVADSANVPQIAQ